MTLFELDNGPFSIKTRFAICDSNKDGTLDTLLLVDPYCDYKKPRELKPLLTRDLTPQNKSYVWNTIESLLTLSNQSTTNNSTYINLSDVSIQLNHLLREMDIEK